MATEPNIKAITRYTKFLVLIPQSRTLFAGDRPTDSKAGGVRAPITYADENKLVLILCARTSKQERLRVNVTIHFDKSTVVYNGGFVGSEPVGYIDAIADEAVDSMLTSQTVLLHED
jgi:hypothetical protein